MRVDLDHAGQLKTVGDVAFDFGVSGELRSGFAAAASRLNGQRDSRVAARTAGGKDFSGYYSGLFASNGRTQVADLDEIVTNLRLVVSRVIGLEAGARAENARRGQAREWARKMIDRNRVEVWLNDKFGGDEPPVPEISETGGTASVAAPRRGRRQTPAGGGGPAGGRSSARPQALDRFASTSRGLDASVKGLAGTLRDWCAQFSARCGWAHLDASGVIGGLEAWLGANGQDAAWAATVAAAFRRAGGSGSVRSLPDAGIAAALKGAHVAARRADIQIDPPTAWGSPPSSGFADDPVNAATGNFVEPATDLEFGGGCASLGWSRLYNSMSSVAGGLGPGWASVADSRLVTGGEGARWVRADGRHVVFPRQGGGWARATGENLWLRAVDQEGEDGGQMVDALAPGAAGTGGVDGGDAALVVADNAGGRWGFSRAGWPLWESRGAGTRIGYEWDGGGRLNTPPPSTTSRSPAPTTTTSPPPQAPPSSSTTTTLRAAADRIRLTLWPILRER